jgi:hypothetical protein
MVSSFNKFLFSKLLGPLLPHRTNRSACCQADPRTIFRTALQLNLSENPP